MSDENKSIDSVTVSGQLATRLRLAPLRVLAVVTGFVLVRGLVALVARFLLLARSNTTATIEGDTLLLKVDYSLFGKTVKERTVTTPLREVVAVQLEKRERYIQVVVGFGCLMVGIFAGVHWLLDGLRAGYPYLALLGAGVILLGVVLDIVLYLFVPGGNSSETLTIATGAWYYRLRGIDPDSGESFMALAGGGFPSQSSPS